MTFCRDRRFGPKQLEYNRWRFSHIHEALWNTPSTEMDSYERQEEGNNQDQEELVLEDCESYRAGYMDLLFIFAGINSLCHTEIHPLESIIKTDLRRPFTQTFHQTDIGTPVTRLILNRIHMDDVGTTSRYLQNLLC